MTINQGEGTDKNPEGFIINPIGDGRPLTPDETADLAELRGGLGLIRSGWLQKVIDAEYGEHPAGSKVFGALQAHMQDLTANPARDFSAERRAILVAYDVLRLRTTRVATGEVSVGRMWLWLRSDEAYVGPFNQLEPGIPAQHVTGAAGRSQFAIGWELGYTGSDAERWFVTHPLITGLERLDFPLDRTTYVQEAPAEGFVEISSVRVRSVDSLIPKQ